MNFNKTNIQKLFAIGSTGTTISNHSFRVIANDARIAGGEGEIVVLIDLGNGCDFIEWYNTGDIHEGWLRCNPSKASRNDLNILSVKQPSLIERIKELFRG